MDEEKKIQEGEPIREPEKSPAELERQEEDKAIAEETINQLGGREFKLLTGSKDFIFDKGGKLRFRIPMSKGINFVEIALDTSDTYTVEFISATVERRKVISTHKDIYNDMLRDLFEKETGLYTSLRPRR